MVKQYNEFSKKYSESIATTDNVSRSEFYKTLTFDFQNKMLLDLACGDGQDTKEYVQRGATYFGIDESENLIEMAKETHPDTDFQVGDMRSLPYPDNSFDIVLSKYAIGSVPNINDVFTEVSRVLKKGGVFAYLTTHPLRLFMEQTATHKDYFAQKDVDLAVFGGKFTIVEPSHTFNEFLSKEYLINFDMVHFSEHADLQSADFPDRDIYPDFFIIVGKSR